MGLRQWTREAIEDGGVFRWFGGLSIKFLFEGGSALVFGFATARIFTALFSDDALSAYVAGHTFEVIWLAATVSLFMKYTKDKFVESLE